MSVGSFKRVRNRARCDHFNEIDRGLDVQVLEIRASLVIHWCRIQEGYVQEPSTVVARQPAPELSAQAPAVPLNLNRGINKSDLE